MTYTDDPKNDELLKRQFKNLRRQEQRSAPAFPDENTLEALISSKSTEQATKPTNWLKPNYMMPMAASLAAIAMVFYLQPSIDNEIPFGEDDALATYMQIMDSNLVTTDELLVVSDALMPSMTELPLFQDIEPSPAFDI